MDILVVQYSSSLRLSSQIALVALSVLSRQRKEFRAPTLHNVICRDSLSRVSNMVFKTTHKPEDDVIMNLQVGNWELTCTELSPVSVEHHPIQDPILSSLHLILLQSGKQLFFWVYSQVENLKLERSNAETKTAESEMEALNLNPNL